MEKNHVKEFEQVIIDYAKANELGANETLSDCQTALLNIAGWVCECYGYSKQEYESFMRDYAAQVTAAIDCTFKRG